jgi:hypothetical protein
MRVQPDGDLEVSPGETVTVAIEATDTAFLAHTGHLQLGQWASVTHPSPLKEQRTFTVSNTFSTNFSFTTGFDFSLGPGGKIAATAHYTVRISGTGPGGAVRLRDVGPQSILPSLKVFSFEVGRG